VKPRPREKARESQRSESRLGEETRGAVSCIFPRYKGGCAKAIKNLKKKQGAKGRQSEGQKTQNRERKSTVRRNQGKQAPVRDARKGSPLKDKKTER